VAVVIGRVFRRSGYGGVESFERGFRVSLLEGDDALQVERVGLYEISLECLLAKCESAVESACPVMDDGFGNIFVGPGLGVHGRRSV